METAPNPKTETRPFRFAVMGAAKIARKFCDAVRLTEGCELAAIASRSAERAEAFARENGLKASYGGYAEMLKAEKPDCVYIAVTTDAHYDLTMMCLNAGVPVLCEKAMFQTGRQAKTALALSEEHHVFAMEAMWSRFLPAILQAKQWIDAGEIGDIRRADFAIGFAGERDPNNRLFSPKLGGGVAFDLTVYGYEITTFLLGAPTDDIQVSADWAETGVDETDRVALRLENGAQAFLTTTFASEVEQQMTIEGTKGTIRIPRPNSAESAFLSGPDGTIRETFRDTETKNGFVYEAREAMECVRAGKVESAVVPHSLTLSCAELFDRIAASKP